MLLAIEISNDFKLRGHLKKQSVVQNKKDEMYITFYVMPWSDCVRGPLLLIWINFNPSMDK